MQRLFILILVFFSITIIPSSCRSYDKIKSKIIPEKTIVVKYTPSQVSIGNNLGKNVFDIAIDSSQKNDLPPEFKELGEITVARLKEKFPDKQILLNSDISAIYLEIKDRVFYDYRKENITLKMMVDLTFKDSSGRQLQWLPKFATVTETSAFTGSFLKDMIKALPPEKYFPALKAEYNRKLTDLLLKL